MISNVFHKRTGHTSELVTKTLKLTITTYYYTTTLHNNPYLIVIKSSCLLHV
jgi:hypothetical protein